MDFFRVPMRLDLFDGESAGAAAAAPAGDNGAQGETNGVPGNTRRGKAGETKVVYGKQPVDASAVTPDATQQAPDAGEQKAPEMSPKEKRRAFLEMVNGDFKDIYTQETQRLLNDRFKSVKATEAERDELKAIVNKLYEHYGIIDDDLKVLGERIDSDDAYLAEAAEKAGMTKEAYREYIQAKRKSKALETAEANRVGNEAAQAQVRQWLREGSELKEKYPEFDFDTEWKNPSFKSMLRAGTPVEHAYLVLHLADIMASAKQSTAIETEKKVVDNLRAKGSRPAENGASSTSAVITKDDVHKLTKKDRADVAARALRGERISF